MLEFFIVFTIAGFVIGYVFASKYSITIILTTSIVWGFATGPIWGLATLGEMFLGYYIAALVFDDSKSADGS